MITPQFIGQRYKDTNTGNIWIANSTTPGDWTLEVQNMQVLWTPHSMKAGEALGFDSIGNIPGLTSLTFLQASSIMGFDIAYIDDLVSLSFPNLVSIDAGGLAYPVTNFGHHNSLTTLSMPSLQTTIDTFSVYLCPLLTTLSLPSYTTCGNEFSVTVNATLASVSAPNLNTIVGKCEIRDNPLLTSISLPSWLPTNGTILDFINNKLSATSVNHILARAVANPAFVGTSISLTGINNAAPTGQGLLDKATLTGRGVVVSTN